MWREYGSKGNGAALVIDVQKINYRPDHPLLIAGVAYATAQERIQQLRDHLNAWAELTLGLNLPDPRLNLAARDAFLFVKLVALTTKHRGFHEEREVRIIYYPERDPRGYLNPNLTYHLGPRGLEPKLKYQFGKTLRTADKPHEDLPTGPLVDLISCILLGPTVSSPLAKQSFIRMLQSIGVPELQDRVLPSTIPLRPTFQI